jgi:putative membrane protein
MPSSYVQEKKDMRSILSVVCCFALCCLPALAQKEHAAKGASGAPMTDQQFVDFAAQTDMMEAHLGQMAQDQAARQDVKDYAQMLITYERLSPTAGHGDGSQCNGLQRARHRASKDDCAV